MFGNFVQKTAFRKRHPTKSGSGAGPRRPPHEQNCSTWDSPRTELLYLGLPTIRIALTGTPHEQNWFTGPSSQCLVAPRLPRLQDCHPMGFQVLPLGFRAHHWGLLVLLLFLRSRVSPLGLLVHQVGVSAPRLQEAPVTWVQNRINDEPLHRYATTPPVTYLCNGASANPEFPFSIFGHAHM